MKTLGHGRLTALGGPLAVLITVVLFGTTLVQAAPPAKSNALTESPGSTDLLLAPEIMEPEPPAPIEDAPPTAVTPPSAELTDEPPLPEPTISDPKPADTTTSELKAEAVPVTEPAVEEPAAKPVVDTAEAEVPAPAAPVAEEVAAEPEVSKPQPPINPSDAAALDSPTRSYEEYERARDRNLHVKTLPRYSINFTVAPKAFAKADLRAPTRGGFDQTDPNLYGILLGYEHTFFKVGGVFMAGIDGGIYGSTLKDPYSNLLAGFQALTPHLHYQALFMPRQWVVPSLKAGYEFLRYSYMFQNKPVKGFKTFPRFDLGLMIFLNLLEPSAAGQMHGNYGIKRTYLTGYYSVAIDSSKTDFDLSENTWRVGLRFEY